MPEILEKITKPTGAPKTSNPVIPTFNPINSSKIKGGNKKIIADAKQKTEELNNLAFVIEKVVNEKILIGKHEDNYKSIYLHQIISIHTESKKIICEAKDGNFSIKNRIYELSTLCPNKYFFKSLVPKLLILHK